MYAVTTERSEPLDQIIAREVESFVDVLQAFGRHRLDADQCAADARCTHRVEKCRVLRRFHRDLCVKHHVRRQFRELGHQIETLATHRLELAQPRLVGTASRFRKVIQRDGIEVVVGERNESKTLAPEFDDLPDHRVDGALPGLLTVGPPDRAERAMFRTAAHRLHGRPHVSALGQQVPAGGDEIFAGHSSCVVHGRRRPAIQSRDDFGPDDVPVAFDHGVSRAMLARFLGKQRRMDAAVDHPGAALTRLPADFVAA